MTLKHRVKKIEKAVVLPSEKPRPWFIRSSYNEDENDPEGRKELEDKIKAIEDGKVQHRDGGYYRKGDVFFIMARIFIHTNPNEPKRSEKPILKEKEAKTLPMKESIEEQIETFKKRKRELEKKIEEKENVTIQEK